MLKRFIYFTTLLLLCVPIPAQAFSTPQDRGNIDLVLVVDLSKSMRGVGGTANIFDRVQKTSKDLVRELRPGDTVTLIPFADAARGFPTITLYGDAERERLFEMIDELEAEGNWTHTAEALRLGLEEAGRLENVLPEHRRIVFILTDGLNDPPPGSRADGLSLDEIARSYANKPWYVYQVQYGAEVDEELREAIEKHFPNGGTTLDRDAEGGIDSLRPVIEQPPVIEEPPPTPEPEPFVWSAEPDELLIVLAAPDSQEEASLALTLPDGVGAGALRTDLLRDEIPEAITLEHELIYTPQGRVSIRLRATATNALKNGSHPGTIRVTVVDTTQFVAAPLEIPVVVKTAMVSPTWPYWLGGLTGLLLLIGLAGWAVTAVRKQRLFGKLEYWPTSSPSQPQKIADDLRRFGRNAVLGSSDLPIRGADKPLATLTVTKGDGKRLVTVEPQEGVRLIHDGRHTGHLQLYDRDTFELDGWTFRYGSTGAVGRRPRQRPR